MFLKQAAVVFTQPSPSLYLSEGHEVEEDRRDML